MSAAEPAQQVLRHAVVRLLKRRPFFGQLLLGVRREEASGSHAVGMTVRNGLPTLCVDPARLARFTPAEQEALLEHVLKHLLHLHPLRRKERQASVWDRACDLAINPGIAGLPAAALLPERWRLPVGLAAEEYYPLLQQPCATGNLEGDGFGDAEGTEAQRLPGPGERDVRSAHLGAPLDDHRLWREADSTPQRLAETAVRQLVRDAWRVSGESSGELQALLADWLAPAAIPWPQVLRQFVATAGRVGRRSTWQREHRRFAHDTPGQCKRRRLQLLVAVDVSDSTDQRPLREAFARELLQIARGRESRITVLYAGSRIQRIVTFNGAPGVVEVYRGGGFTDLRPVFNYAQQMHPRPAAVIYLTDGFGEAPPTAELPTLWVLTAAGRRPAPWGVELRLDGEQQEGMSKKWGP